MAAWRALTTRSIPRPRMMRKEFDPSSEWDETPKLHILFVYLPGFQKDGIRVFSEPRILEVKGDNGQLHFQKSFDVPEDGDIKQTRAIFEEGTLTVSIPKVPNKANVEPKGGDEASSSNTKTDEIESSLNYSLSDIIGNKGPLVASIVSFTVGVLQSRKSHPDPPPPPK